MDTFHVDITFLVEKGLHRTPYNNKQKSFLYAASLKSNDFKTLCCLFIHLLVTECVPGYHRQSIFYQMCARSLRIFKIGIFLKKGIIHSFIHSFIPDIHIASLQETYSEALSVQLRSKR